MAHEFHLPDIGEGLIEATIISWYVEVGDVIGLDEPLVEVETDKAVVDIPSPYAGVLLFRGGEPGSVLEVESLLAVVGEPGEVWSASPTSSVSSGNAAPIVGSLQEATETIVSSSGAAAALPKVRRLAAQLGVDLGALGGSGPGGRITEDDVRAAAIGDDQPVERVQMSATRRSIADHMTQAWREIPHVTTYGEAPAEPLLERRAAMGKPTLEALLITEIVPILVDHPEFNASLSGDYLLYKKHYDIGFAVDGPAGLVVAVVRDATARSLADLDAEVRRLATAAKERKLAPAEMRGQTFTISNIGAVGGGYGTPLVPLGTSAILSIGSAQEKAVVRDGSVVVGRQFPLSLSYDHRIIDGAAGRSFMAAVVAAMSA